MPRAHMWTHTRTHTHSHTPCAINPHTLHTQTLNKHTHTHTRTRMHKLLQAHPNWHTHTPPMHNQLCTPTHPYAPHPTLLTHKRVHTLNTHACTHTRVHTHVVHAKLTSGSTAFGLAPCWIRALTFAAHNTQIRMSTSTHTHTLHIWFILLFLSRHHTPRPIVCVLSFPSICLPSWTW